MITKIEIDGFKSFHEFAVELQPFQVFIGPNGAGKSNLFDAIVLLSNLAGDNLLYDAFRKSRGEIGELFMAYPDGERARVMSFAVEMLISRTIADSLGITAEVSYTRLRYALEIERRLENNFERLYVARETLESIVDDDDRWTKRHIPAHARKDWVVRNRRAPYISTEQKAIYKHQDGRAGRKQAISRDRLERTVLSTVSSAEYPTAFAARQELANWRFLQLNPTELRTPSDIYSTTELRPDGSNLAAVLYRMAQDDEFALTDISRDMANLVSGITRISVEPIREREEFVLNAEMQNGAQFSSRVLSDGILRLLTLVTLKNDPAYQGVLCFEEPENGVHPFRLEQVMGVLKSLATNFKESEANQLPKQVLVNTHSPSLISYIPENSLLYVEMRTRERRQETRMIPVVKELFEDEQEQYYTLAQINRYLDARPMDEKRQELERSE